MFRIAIVEDNLDDLDRLAGILGRRGQCSAFKDAETFLKAIHHDTYDLACIDWSLPGLTGVDLVKRIREGAQAPNIPILLVSARDSDEDVVAGLLSGADDYITKPVREAVLAARVEALLRRLAPANDRRLEIHGDYTFDHSRSLVVARGDEQVLTTKELNLALLMFRNVQRPLARTYIMEEVWGPNSDVSSRTLDTHVCRLKSKLGLSPKNGYSFRTVYGFGYRLEKMP